MFKFGKKSLSILNDERLDKRVVKLSKLALNISKVDFSVIDGYRTEKEQFAIYSSGMSEADGTIIKSAHQSGKAIDVLPYVKGLDCWDYNNKDVRIAWQEVHRAFLRASRILGYCIELGITYDIGSNYDYPHIELKD